MSIKSKDYLKSVFETGDVPTGENFVDLIDSCANEELKEVISSAASAAVYGHIQGNVENQTNLVNYIDNTIDSEIALGGKIDTTFVRKTVTINSYPLSGDINLTKSDVGLSEVDNTADIDKNVNSALTLTNSRNVVLSGSVSGSAIFNGSSDITIPVTVIADSHNHTLAEGDFTVTGNLYVRGSTTSIESDIMIIDDPIFTLGGSGDVLINDHKDRGIEFKYNDGESKTGFFGYNALTNKFTFIPDAINSSEVFNGTKGTIDANLEWSDVLNKPDPKITVVLSGAVSGTGNVTLTDLADGTINISTISQPGSITLGTDTSGNYLVNVAASSGIYIDHTPSEGSTATITNTGVLSVNGSTGIINGIATEEFVESKAATAIPLANGSESTGTSELFALEDHIHPIDLTRAASGQEFYLGTTKIAINRPSAPISLTGITNIDGNANTASAIAGLTQYGILYQANTSVTSSLPLGNVGQILVSNGTSGAPSWNSVSNLSVGNADTLDGLDSIDFTRYSATGILNNSIGSASWTANYTDVNNVDHIWFDHTLNNWNFCADTTYKGTANANVVAGTFVSNVATGTAPFSVLSTTKVNNLNADLLDGYNTSIISSPSTIVVRDSNSDITSRNINVENVILSQAITASNNDTIFYSSKNNQINKNTSTGLKTSLGLNNVENIALSTWTGSSNITTVGTITSGTWNATIGSVSGANLTNLNASNLTSGTVSGDRGVVAGVSETSFIKYNGLSHLAGTFYSGTTNPSGNNRLNYSGYFYPTFINLSASTDTTSTASHYFVETDSDGFVRPKLLSDVRSEIVTLDIINSVSGSANSALKVPTGTTLQRPTPDIGMVRYNSDLASFEGYGSEGWGEIGGGGGLTSEAVSVNFTAEANTRYIVNTASSGVNVTLPSSPIIGDTIEFVDASNYWSTNNVLLLRNGKLINTLAEDFYLDISNVTVVATYASATVGWSIKVSGIDVSQKADLQNGLVLTSQLASGGTPGSTTYLAGDRTWKTVTSGATLSDDTSTNATYYPTFATATSGAMTTAKVSSTKLTFNPSTGTLYSTIFNSSSDENLKTNIKQIENPEVINNLTGVTFNWKDTNEPSVGVIAQELEQFIPELVSTDQNGTKSVNYNGLIGYLIENIKQLNIRVIELENKLG